MDVLRDVLNQFLRNAMWLIVGEGNGAGSTDENQIAEAMRLEEVMVCKRKWW